MEVRACLGCSYDLAGTPESGGLRVCPECGYRNPRRFFRTSHWRRQRVLIAAGIAFAPIVGYIAVFWCVRGIAIGIAQYLAMFSPIALVVVGIASGLGSGALAVQALIGPNWIRRSSSDKLVLMLLSMFVLGILMGGVGAAAAYFFAYPMMRSVLPTC